MSLRAGMYAEYLKGLQEQEQRPKAVQSPKRRFCCATIMDSNLYEVLESATPVLEHCHFLHW